ncbi:hypothetical protein HYR54_15865 [Candidatus Acetothermia bacterium]|nr:hypothetical protein [Candidatus Acetothermia bacterium]
MIRIDWFFPPVCDRFFDSVFSILALVAFDVLAEHFWTQSKGTAYLGVSRCDFGKFFSKLLDGHFRLGFKGFFQKIPEVICESSIVSPLLKEYLIVSSRLRWHHEAMEVRALSFYSNDSLIANCNLASLTNRGGKQ